MSIFAFLIISKSSRALPIVAGGEIYALQGVIIEIFNR